jgi:hypothetical protein
MFWGCGAWKLPAHFQKAWRPSQVAVQLGVTQSRSTEASRTNSVDTPTSFQGYYRKSVHFSPSSHRAYLFPWTCAQAVS